MTSKQELDELKSHLPDYLSQKGVDFQNGKAFPCLNPQHSDNHPSMVYYRDKNICHCFACGASPDLFAIIGYDYGLNSFGDQIKKAKELFGRRDYSKESIPKARFVTPPAKKEQEPEKLEDYSSYLKKCRINLSDARNFATINNYISSRGLSWNTIKHFGCGFDPYWRSPKALAEGRKVPYSPRLIIPSSMNGYLARDIRPKSELTEEQQKWQKMKAGRMIIFNSEALHNPSARVCFIVEGEIDAMSIWQSGCEAVALGSTAMVKTFLKNIEEGGCKNILIPLLDNDGAGRRANEDLEKGLKELGVPYYHVSRMFDYGKDANEALTINPQWFGAWVRSTAREAYRTYNKPQTVSEDFMKNLRNQCFSNTNSNTYYFAKATASPYNDRDAVVRIEETKREPSGEIKSMVYSYEVAYDKQTNSILVRDYAKQDTNLNVVRMLTSSIEKAETEKYQKRSQKCLEK